MSRVVSLLRFVWEFVVGDDWRIAAGVAVGLGLTAGIAHSPVAAWWVLPAAILLLLGLSVWRAARRRA